MKETAIDKLSYEEKHKLSITNREKFFGYYADKLLTFTEPYSQVYNNNLTEAKWFTGGKLNACYN